MPASWAANPMRLCMQKEAGSSCVCEFLQDKSQALGQESAANVEIACYVAQFQLKVCGMSLFSREDIRG
jgi:hypothetical protein